MGISPAPSGKAPAKVGTFGATASGIDPGPPPRQEGVLSLNFGVYIPNTPGAGFMSVGIPRIICWVWGGAQHTHLSTTYWWSSGVWFKMLTEGGNRTNNLRDSDQQGINPFFSPKPGSYRLTLTSKLGSYQSRQLVFVANTF